MKASGKDEEDIIRLQLVDDHFFVRMGLADSLGDESRIEVVAQAASGKEAIEAFVKYSPDVVIMDLQLPDQSGIEVVRELKKRDEGLRCLMLSVNESEEEIFRAVEAGAIGYLPKSTERAELVEAIFSVGRGEHYFPEAISRKLRDRFSRVELSPREMEMLRCLVRGRSNKEAAVEMGISEATVKLHAGNVFEKLGVMDRTQAVTEGIRRGLVRLDE